MWIPVQGSLLGEKKKIIITRPIIGLAVGKGKTSRKNRMEKCPGFTKDARVMSEIQEQIYSSLGHIENQVLVSG